MLRLSGSERNYTVLTQYHNKTTQTDGQMDTSWWQILWLRSALHR